MLKTIIQNITAKDQPRSLSVDSFYDENRSRTYKYTELLNKAVFICTDNNITRRALSYKKYLVEILGVSEETSAHCTLDLYFPLLTTKQGV